MTRSGTRPGSIPAGWRLSCCVSARATLGWTPDPRDISKNVYVNGAVLVVHRIAHASAGTKGTRHKPCPVDLIRAWPRPGVAGYPRRTTGRVSDVLPRLVLCQSLDLGSVSPWRELPACDGSRQREEALRQICTKMAKTHSPKGPIHPGNGFEHSASGIDHNPVVSR